MLLGGALVPPVDEESVPLLPTEEVPSDVAVEEGCVTLDAPVLVPAPDVAPWLDEVTAGQPWQSPNRVPSSLQVWWPWPPRGQVQLTCSPGSHAPPEPASCDSHGGAQATASSATIGTRRPSRRVTAFSLDTGPRVGAGATVGSDVGPVKLEAKQAPHAGVGFPVDDAGGTQQVAGGAESPRPPRGTHRRGACTP